MTMSIKHITSSSSCCYLIVIILGFILFTSAEVVQFDNCKYPEGTQINCTVHEVRVDPCKEAKENKPCGLKRGFDASIAFDYTANFQGDVLESRAFWINSVVDLPFLGMNTNACASTVCPVQSGQNQTYSIALPIVRAFPARTYELKWKLWNQQQQECCFTFFIKLLK